MANADEKTFHGTIAFKALNRLRGLSSSWGEQTEEDRAGFEAMAEAARNAGSTGGIEHELTLAEESDDKDVVARAGNVRKALEALRALTAVE